MSITITNRRGPLKIVISYFQAPAKAPACDILRVRHVTAPPEDNTWTWVEADTLFLDLTLSEDALLKEMKEGTRYEIRRAMKRDALQVEVLDRPTPKQRETFRQFYREFVGRKGLEVPNLDFMDQLDAQGALNLSWVKHPDLGNLVCHMHMADDHRSRLVLSGHAFLEGGSDAKEMNALVGRANRYLHWKDICHFRSRGLTEYDFGGVYLKGDDPALAGVAHFKQGFGGRIVREYKWLKGISFAGRLAVAWSKWHNEAGQNSNPAQKADERKQPVRCSDNLGSVESAR